MPNNFKGSALDDSDKNTGLNDPLNGIGENSQDSPPIAGPQPKSPLEESSDSGNINDPFALSAGHTIKPENGLLAKPESAAQPTGLTPPTVRSTGVGAVA